MINTSLIITTNSLICDKRFNDFLFHDSNEHTSFLTSKSCDQTIIYECHKIIIPVRALKRTYKFFM